MLALFAAMMAPASGASGGAFQASPGKNSLNWSWPAPIRQKAQTAAKNRFAAAEGTFLRRQTVAASAEPIRILPHSTADRKAHQGRRQSLARRYAILKASTSRASGFDKAATLIACLAEIGCATAKQSRAC